MNEDHIQTILDALEFKERQFTERVEREPKTRGGKPNKLRLHLQEELDKIAEARQAFSIDHRFLVSVVGANNE